MSSSCRLSVDRSGLDHVPVLAAGRATSTRVQEVDRRFRWWNHMGRCSRSGSRHSCSTWNLNVPYPRTRNSWSRIFPGTLTENPKTWYGMWRDSSSIR